jgi:hypothetical protein
MVDEKPEQPRPEEESKKDTVRINLPPGLLSRGAPAAPTPAPPAAKPQPAAPPGPPEEEAKKETAVMGRPLEAPKPKKDTSRVQVAAAKPAVPEQPRPTVKLRREPEAAPAPAAAPAARPAVAAVPSAAPAPLSVAAMVLSVAVLLYLAVLALG